MDNNKCKQIIFHEIVKGITITNNNNKGVNSWEITIIVEFELLRFSFGGALNYAKTKVMVSQNCQKGLNPLSPHKFTKYYDHASKTHIRNNTHTANCFLKTNGMILNTK